MAFPRRITLPYCAAVLAAALIAIITLSVHIRASHSPSLADSSAVLKPRGQPGQRNAAAAQLTAGTVCPPHYRVVARPTMFLRAPKEVKF